MFNSMTFGLIKSILTEEAYAAFEEWMRGQTVSVNDDGEHIVYAWDFERWVRESIQHKKPVTSQMGPDWD
jgi:hypothetical protein